MGQEVLKNTQKWRTYSWSYLLNLQPDDYVQNMFKQAAILTTYLLLFLLFGFFFGGGGAVESKSGFSPSPTSGSPRRQSASICLMPAFLLACLAFQLGQAEHRISVGWNNTAAYSQRLVKVSGKQSGIFGVAVQGTSCKFEGGYVCLNTGFSFANFSCRILILPQFLSLLPFPGCRVNSLNGTHHVTTARFYDQPSGPANESSVTRQHRNSRWQINILCFCKWKKVNLRKPVSSLMKV